MFHNFAVLSLGGGTQTKRHNNRGFWTKTAGICLCCLFGFLLCAGVVCFVDFQQYKVSCISWLLLVVLGWCVDVVFCLFLVLLCSFNSAFRFPKRSSFKSSSSVSLIFLLFQKLIFALVSQTSL